MPSPVIAARGRPPRVSPDRRLRRLVSAVFDLPYALEPVQRAYSGLTSSEWKHTRPQAARKRLIERGVIPQARPKPRCGWGPTSAAGDFLRDRGRWSLEQLSEAFTGCQVLDYARQLIPQWQTRGTVYWALSPFWVASKNVRAQAAPVKPEQPVQFDPLCELRLDLLACVRTSAERYVTVAVLVDPGWVKLDWFYQLARSFQAWARRPEFKPYDRQFPLLVVEAANRLRHGQMFRLWREMVPAGAAPLPLRLTTRDQLACRPTEQEWLTQAGTTVTAMFAGPLNPGRQPSVMPRPEPDAPWWGQPRVVRATVVNGPALTPLRNTGMLRSAVHLSGWRWQAVRDMQVVGERQRQMLEQIGRYPLIEPRALYVSLRVTPNHGPAYLAKLKPLQMVEWREKPAVMGVPRAPGLLLTERALGLLASLVGSTPQAYLRLRRWPGAWVEGKFVYSVEGLERIYDHYQVTLDFMEGLLHSPAPQRLQLATWDHSQCLYEYFNPGMLRKLGAAREPYLNAVVIPDAAGQVIVYGANPRHTAATDFWLEVDRLGHTGTLLRSKLADYYTALASKRLLGAAPRLLIVVDGRGEPGDGLGEPGEGPVEAEVRAEARLRRLQQLMCAHERRLKVRLDARLVRLDQIQLATGRLDPSQPVWRTQYASTYVDAFNRPTGDEALVRAQDLLLGRDPAVN